MELPVSHVRSLFTNWQHIDISMHLGLLNRHSYYSYNKDGGLRRDLVKYWGIGFVFLVGGEAGKFCFVNFILHVTSSLGLLGLVCRVFLFLLSSDRIFYLVLFQASVVCELVLSYVKNEVLHESKFKKVDTVSKMSYNTKSLWLFLVTLLFQRKPGRVWKRSRSADAAMPDCR